MKLVFIDETSDSKFADYFGICAAVIDAANYRTIKNGFQTILVRGGWNPEIEFKGSYLFSASSGDTNISIDHRIDICSEILNLSGALHNARMKFFYLSCRNVNDQAAEYLQRLPQVVKSAIGSPSGYKNGKDLVTIYCDHRNDVTASQIRSGVLPVLNEKNWHMVEDVQMVKSNFQTVGVLFTDIVAYLAARIDTIENDIELFSSIPADQLENNGKVKKLRTSTRLIQKVKEFKWKKLD